MALGPDVLLLTMLKRLDESVYKDVYHFQHLEGGPWALKPGKPNENRNCYESNSLLLKAISKLKKAKNYFTDNECLPQTSIIISMVSGKATALKQHCKGFAISTIMVALDMKNLCFPLI